MPVKTLRFSNFDPIDTLADLQSVLEDVSTEYERRAKQPSTLPLTAQVRVGLTVSGKIKSVTLYYDETEPETVFPDGP